MKKTVLLALAGSIALTAMSAVPFEKGRLHDGPAPVHKTLPGLRQAPMRHAAPVTVVEEDFSAFSSGSESAPASEITYENGYHVPAALTAQPGWTGGGIHPAGGAVALLEYNNGFGYISTPPCDLAGTATLTLRARNADPAKKSSLWIALCDDNYGPGSDQGDFELTDEWQTITLVATEGSFEDFSYFQIQAEYGPALIDDVKIEFRRDRLPSPYALPAVNNSPTEFTASWEGMTDKYLLTVIATEMPETIVKGTLTEGFDSLNVLDDGVTVDSSDPGYPEGWEFKFAGGADVSTVKGNYSSPSVALHFDSVGDEVISPVTPEPLSRLSFWVRPDSMEEDPEVLSMIRVQIYHSLTDKWETIAQLPYYWMSEAGAEYSFVPEALGEDATRVCIDMIQKGKITFFIDDVNLGYTSRGVRKPLFEDLEVEGYSYTVSGIRPENDYHYYVKSTDGDLVSGASSMIWVDGVSGLKPEVLAPTDVTTHGFTANWMPLGHASEYKVEVARIVRGDETEAAKTIILEDFDGVRDAGSDWESPFDFGERGMASTGWGATQPVWKEGMVGTSGTSWIGAAGLVFTPFLDLTPLQGSCLQIIADVETTVDMLVDGSGNPVLDENGKIFYEGVVAMLLNSPSDTASLSGVVFDMPKMGTNRMVVSLPVPEGVDVSNVIVAFMTKTGSAFYVDRANLFAFLKPGMEIKAPYTTERTEDTSFRFDGLDSYDDYIYTVSAIANRNLDKYVSEVSDPILVVLSSTGIDGVDAADDAPAEFYTLQGIRVSEPADGIYIMRRGGVTSKVLIRK